MVSEHSPSRDGKLTRINPMQVVKVRRKAQSFDRAVNILLDMRRRIGNTTIVILTENGKSAFRCN